MNLIVGLLGAVVVSGILGYFLGWLVMRSAEQSQAKRLRMASPYAAEQAVLERSGLPLVVPALRAVDARREP